MSQALRIRIVGGSLGGPFAAVLLRTQAESDHWPDGASARSDRLIGFRLPNP
jgi:hypothetical protein